MARTRIIRAIAPPGQEGWREAPGWWVKNYCDSPDEKTSVNNNVATKSFAIKADFPFRFSEFNM
jgi:hypothetical protein